MRDGGIDIESKIHIQETQESARTSVHTCRAAPSMKDKPILYLIDTKGVEL